jgi:YfiH family protein
MMIVPDWPAPPGIGAASTTRDLAGHSRPPFERFNLGLRCGDEPAAVAANRALLAQRLPLPSAPVWLQQVHGTDVHVADEAGSGEPVADGAVSRRAGVTLAVLTADCLPVLFASEDGGAIGVAHAGWRGLAAGVLERTLQRLGCAPGGVLAWIGPGIGAASYEVGGDVREAFLDHDAAAAGAFMPTRPGHWRCDLAALARRRLAAAGVTLVYGGDFDTFTDPRFYSYRREPRTGRFATLIWRSR